MEQKQTAVEWLKEKLIESGISFLSEEIEFINQAKQMEKEQIIDAYAHGQNNGYMYRDGQSNIIEAEQYYNETFKSE